MSEATDWTRLLFEKQQQQAAADRAAQTLRQTQLNQAFDASDRLAAAMKKYRLDGIANKLINEEPVPRAVAVDAQGRPDAAANAAARKMFPRDAYRRDVSPFNGGVEGLELLHKYQDHKQRQASGYSQPSANLSPTTTGWGFARHAASPSQNLAQAYTSPALPSQSLSPTPAVGTSEPDFTLPVADVPVVGTPAQFDSLPSGAVYYREDGLRYRKP